MKIEDIYSGLNTEEKLRLSEYEKKRREQLNSMSPLERAKYHHSTGYMID